MRHLRIENDPNREPRFWVQVESPGATYRVLAFGELDLAAVPTLEQAMMRAEQASAPRIVLDLNGITFIDSSGVQFFLRTCARLKAAGDRLRMTRPSPAVEAMIDMSGIRAMLPLEE